MFKLTKGLSISGRTRELKSGHWCATALLCIYIPTSIDKITFCSLEPEFGKTRTRSPSTIRCPVNMITHWNQSLATPKTDRHTLTRSINNTETNGTRSQLPSHTTARIAISLAVFDYDKWIGAEWKSTHPESKSINHFYTPEHIGTALYWMLAACSAISGSEAAGLDKPGNCGESRFGTNGSMVLVSQMPDAPVWSGRRRCTDDRSVSILFFRPDCGGGSRGVGCLAGFEQPINGSLVIKVPAWQRDERQLDDFCDPQAEHKRRASIGMVVRGIWIRQNDLSFFFRWEHADCKGKQQRIGFFELQSILILFDILFIPEEASVQRLTKRKQFE